MEKRMVNVNGVNYPVHVGHRALIEFERTAGKPFRKAETLEDSLLLMWCALRHGARTVFLEFPLSFEAFIDYVDEHPEVMPADDTSEKKS